MPTYHQAPEPPACPPGLILWVPVAWYPDPIQILRPLDNKLHPHKEQDLADAWQAADDEWLVLPAKLRPAVVVSSEDEHKHRRAVRLLPMYSVKDAYLQLEERIKNLEIPNVFWLENVPVGDAPVSQIVDCAKTVRLPMALIQARPRIARLDEVTLLAIKEFWRESILP